MIFSYASLFPSQRLEKCVKNTPNPNFVNYKISGYTCQFITSICTIFDTLNILNVFLTIFQPYC